MLVSLVVMVFILTFPIPRIAIHRLGATDLEHLFGVTRVANRGNNQGEKIMRRLVKPSLVTRIVEHWGLTLKRRRQRNISGLYDGILPGEEFLDLSDAFPGYNPVHLLFQVLRDAYSDPVLVHAHASFVVFRSHFVILLGKIKGGQELPTVTCFGGTAIMATYDQIEFADTQKYIGRSRTSWN